MIPNGVEKVIFTYFFWERFSILIICDQVFVGYSYELRSSLSNTYDLLTLLRTNYHHASIADIRKAVFVQQLKFHVCDSINLFIRMPSANIDSNKLYWKMNIYSISKPFLIALATFQNKKVCCTNHSFLQNPIEF